VDVVSGSLLASYTTLGLGGTAARLTAVHDEDEAVAAVRAAGSDLLVLAGGSNVVIGDDGYPGQVVLLRTRGVRATRDGDRVRVTVQAGHPWDEVVATAVDEGWSGIECLSGIPGSAGATPIQNVGAYGQEVAETITAVRAYDRQRDAVVTMAPAECGFVYRGSAFKNHARFVVLAVEFALPLSAGSGPVRYAELARALGVRAEEVAPLKEVRAAVLGLRAGKGMVLDPADADTRSVGSFFTNPVLDPRAYGEFRARAVGAGAVEPVAWPAADGSVKISAAWLIERAGFAKGYGRDGVAISSKHTLALTNRGTGTTAALLDLAREIRAGVAGRFGVTLTPEPVLINCAL
jgi:UDP-N-acetylmuramate dehydrogenase